MLENSQNDLGLMGSFSSKEPKLRTVMQLEGRLHPETRAKFHADGMHRVKRGVKDET
jgi:hypothetical protein